MDAAIILHWESLAKLSGRNVTELSEACQKSRGYLSNLFKMARESPEKVSDPGVTLVLNLSRELRTPVDQLLHLANAETIIFEPNANYDREFYDHSARIFSDVMILVHNMAASKGTRPDLQAVLAWWRSTDGRLSDSGRIQDAFDLIKVPDGSARTVEPHSVGNLSLASQVLGQPSVEGLNQIVSAMPERDQLDLVASYRTASEQGKPTFSDPITVKIELPESGVSEEVEFIRLQLPVFSSDGTPFVGSYCFRLLPTFADFNTPGFSSK